MLYIQSRWDEKNQKKKENDHEFVHAVNKVVRLTRMKPRRDERRGSRNV